MIVPGAGLPPLSGARLLTSWTVAPGVLGGVALLGGSYGVGLRRLAAPWPRRRSVAFGAGVLLLALIGSSAVAVYDDTLFWTRAVQGVVLLVVAPMLLAGGAPLTLARATLPRPAVVTLGRWRRSGPRGRRARPGSRRSPSSRRRSCST